MKKIQDMKEVSVAAPVAAIGYFTGMSKSVALPMPHQSIRTAAKFYTSNGIDQFPVGQPKTEIMLQRKTRVKTAPSFTRLYSKTFRRFGSRGPPMYKLPQTYHLLVGIDPKSEAKLTGISFKAFQNPLSTKDKELYHRHFSGASLVKVLQLKDLDVPVYLHTKRYFLNIGPDKTMALKNKFGLGSYRVLGTALQKDKDRYYKMFRFLKKYPAERSKSYQLDFSKYLDPFKSLRLMVNQNGKILKNTKYGNTYSYANMTIHYTASDIHYHIHKKSSTLSVRKIGKKKGVPVYRNSKKIGKPYGLYKTPPYFLGVVGSYIIGKKKNTLAASPLGIYDLTQTVLASNGKPLHATIYPGSFVPAPAHGVTTIKSAKLIKGDHPIDAIRVRVAGIDGYTKAAAKKVKRVAKKIANMGFTVDVVAGASHQQMKVNVEGIGTVLEPWTTLGAAATIVNGWSGTTVILAVAFAAVTLIYLLGRLLFSKVERQEEVLLLSLFGWDRRHVARKGRLEFAFLGLVALVVSLICSFVLRQWYDFASFVYLIQIGLFVVLLLIVLLSISGKMAKTLTVPKIGRNPGHLIRKNLGYYGRYTRMPFLQLLVVSGLSAFVYMAIQATKDQTNLTVLGQYVNLQTGSLTTLIMAGAYVLALFTIIEGLTGLLQVRREELKIFQSIGWTSQSIFLLLWKETALWTATATLSGGVISLIGDVLLYGFRISAVWTALFTTGAFYAVVLIVAALLLRYRLGKEI